MLKGMTPSEPCGDSRSCLTIDGVFEAYFTCRKHKRNTLNQLGFEINLEHNLVELYHDLKENTYTINPSLAFVVTYPKIREVWAGDFRDRIVHHIIYNALYDQFTNRFIRDSYACIPGRGTHDGLRRISGFARSVTRNNSQTAYYLKADVANFFNSIDKYRLLEILDRNMTIEQDWIKQLVHKIVLHDPRPDVVLRSTRTLFEQVPKHKSFMHAPENRGLPIGNLVSQFFANIYMNELDQFVKHTLKAHYYGRYVDDVILMHEDPSVLNDWYEAMNDFLVEKLGLQFHPHKKQINRVDKGINFIGFIIKPNRTYLRRTSYSRCKQKIKVWEQRGSPLDKQSLDKLSATVTSYLAMLRNVNGYKARCALCQRIVSLFLVADENYTKVLPSSHTDKKK